MTGRREPSDNQLRANLQARAAGLDKRYHRPDFLGLANNDPVAAIGNVLQEGGDAAKGTDSGGITKSHQPTAPHSAALDIEANDVGYIVNVDIGTPATTFKLLADSGSSDLWLPGDACSACGSHPHLGKSSSTFKDTGKQWGLLYGSGNVAGNIVQDTVSIAGMKVEGLQFGVAANESEQFARNTTLYDGIIGLALGKLSHTGGKTFVEALADSKQIPSAIVSYKLPRLTDGKLDGAMTFGGLDASLFKSDTLTTLKNTNTEGFWGAPLDSVKLNGKDMNMGNRSAVFDTGTTLILAPRDDADALHAAIPGAKRAENQHSWLVPCKGTVPLSLSFGGREWEVQAKDLAFQPHDPSKPDGDCESGIAPSYDNDWLLGDVFLKNVYLSTDVAKNQVQLAELS